MSVAGILSSAAFSIGSQIFQARTQKSKQEFQQLGQDLQSGNLSAAQSDFAALQQLHPQWSGSSSSQSTSTVGQDFNQLATDLKAGNLSGAQKDFTQLQQDLQTQETQTHRHHHHHHSDGDGSNAISQLFTQLGTALQSGNLSAAQTAYSTMLQDLQQYAPALATTNATTSGISVSA
jgi:outer membrane protein assembly factor BamD (BamD/ComL family)